MKTKFFELRCAPQNEIKDPNLQRIWLQSINVDISYPSLHRPEFHLLPALLEIDKELLRIVKSSIHECAADTTSQAFKILGFIIRERGSVTIPAGMFFY
mmetsp:Transcript_21604/g.17951  ORF Transcript_21604/g.17951 Transcript_21604/m.17951 type:complete len:99 (+) Transcript_21604:420-716(+)